VIRGRTARHTVGIVSSVDTPNGRGGVTSSWADAPVVLSEGWSIDAGDTTEDTENRTASEVSYTLRGPVSAPVSSRNRLRVFGQDFEVVGDVLTQPGPTSTTSHVLVKVKRAVG
jgi:hypothetical protein